MIFQLQQVHGIKRINTLNPNISFYPVPVKDRLTINYQSMVNETIHIKIIDINGRIIMTKVVDVDLGNNEIGIDFTNITKGGYVVKIHTNSQSTSHIILNN